jgi:hypothetical protein
MRDVRFSMRYGMAKFLLTRGAMTLLPSKSLAFEIAMGRWMALCVHPVCAWRLRSASARAVVVTSYFAASYLGVLTTLLFSR